MSRELAVLGLAVATLACGVAYAPDEGASSEPSRLATAVSCPVVATSCPGGCFAVSAHPVDRSNKCLLARQGFGCSPFDTVGPPAVVCSVGPDETLWVYFEGRQHPHGRFCSGAELEALGYPRCP